MTVTAEYVLTVVMDFICAAVLGATFYLAWHNYH